MTTPTVNSGQLQHKAGTATVAPLPEAPPAEAARSRQIRPEPDARTGVLHTLQSLLNIVVIAIFIITFVVQPFRIPSGSMEPTLLIGDFVLVTKQTPSTDAATGILPSGRVSRGDIIVFHFPVDPGMHLVKRVVGIPGDHLKLRAGRVYINGKLLAESYAVYRPTPPDNFRDNFPRLQSADPDIDSHWWIRMRNLIDDGELIIPAGNYFVLGDNRNDSEDSRYWGFVPRGDIVGKPLLIYFSLRETGDTPDPLAVTADAANPSRRHGALDVLASFARWGRTLQIVR